MWSKAGNTRLLRRRMSSPSTATMPASTSPDRVGHALTAVRSSLEKGRRKQRPGSSAESRAQVSLDAVVDLARLMFTIGEKRKRTDDQLRFNTLVTEWPELAKKRAGDRRRNAGPATLETDPRWHVSWS